jgi:hypothetical protein
VHETFNDHALNLKSEGRYTDVRSEIDVRSFEGVLTVEVFVEADEGNEGVGWWLEVKRLQDRWQVEGYVLGQYPSGQKVLDEVVPRFAMTYEDLTARITEVAELLLQIRPHG